MKFFLAMFLSSVAAFGMAASAYSLTVVPTFDGSITNDPNGPAMVAAINSAIDILQADVADNFTVYMDFVNDTSVDLGENQTWVNNYAYSDYIAALKKSAADANDTNAISNLPNSPTDPLIGGTNIALPLALASHLGLDSGVGPDGFDSTIHLNMSFMNFTRPPTNSNNYDLQAVAEHEMDEVLGTPSGLAFPGPIGAMDLFRYTDNLKRTYTTDGDNAYFSVDGTNLWARFNQSSGGDYGDWWSVIGHWAPPGLTPVQQVQDAFADPGTIVDLGTNELTMLDVVGWTLTSSAPTNAPLLRIVSSGAGQVTVLWNAGLSGYVLQESTDLAPGSWVTSGTGSANPAVITASTSHKFYRLFGQPVKHLDSLAEAARVRTTRTNSLHLVTRVLRPRNP